MIERVGWDALPAALHNTVEAHTGRVLASEIVADGLNCTVALVLTTERGGHLFLKGVRDDQAKAVAALDCEARVNSTVRSVSPAIQHSFRSAGWGCLAFTYVAGRHADLSPGTSDLPAVTRALERMQAFSGSAVPVPSLADRFASYLLPGEAELLTGSALLHTDTNPHNILIADHDGAAYVVDWAMPVAGPAWVDPACTAVRLMESGCAPADALEWLNGFTSWRNADPKSVAIFVDVTCRRWTAKLGHAAQRSNARYRHLLD
ncbi:MULTISPECIES: phosphotransferase [Streptomyces]|uniref:phosphotransferase n=1 Tax=Streptomyces TaxID=1883 RepID=UPI00163C8BB1|nr:MULTISPECIES: phosphotransferase [Streptomyces]MBC2874171.1 phosphotransferase [Streptomyces sp. TYQ1024]UBI40219.1 phosphotransferase [Streptomyces mobaraensis]UKW32797.1 phosphotransferase [Streptomyces sp. TYQ1024]